MKKDIAVCWFRRDLRLSDNPALIKAKEHEHVLPIYILDDCNAGIYSMGEASRWWLHNSLNSLNKSLGDKLSVYKGNPKEIIDQIIERFDIKAIYWNRCYEPWQIKRDTAIKESLRAQGINVETFNGSLLWEPWNIKKIDGNPYRVFTPFYKNGCLGAIEPRKPLSSQNNNHYYINEYIKDDNQIGIDNLNLLPENSWYEKLEPYWEIGEEGALKALRDFIEKGLQFYKDGRNFPAKPCVSRLSPYLHFGEVSTNQLWHTVKSIGDDKNIEQFLIELGWREFSYNQLFYNPELPRKNLQTKFDAFPWDDNMDNLYAWQRGQTGIPMVDAGMRELWQTGYMHNRLRMIVGSFLVKNLRIHWRHGERWFFDTLVDADLASNSANWQWIAGCGFDAAPYFRIFNPVTQGHKFDPDGEYVRKYIPEIAAIPNKYLFNPWEAPEHVLKEAKVKLGETYPHPIIDLKESRKLALDAFYELGKFP